MTDRGVGQVSGLQEEVCSLQVKESDVVSSDRRCGAGAGGSGRRSSGRMAVAGGGQFQILAMAILASGTWNNS